MAIRLKHSDTYSTYFCTFTSYNWLHLFELTKSYSAVYKWFYELRANNIHIISYVIMPNHLHCILFFPEEGFKLNSIISNAKRFLAYEIVNILEQNQDTELLTFLQSSLNKREIEKGQLHKVFKQSFDAKAIYTDKFLLQKMNYIHNNPISGKWQLAQTPESYLYSSARYYFDGVDAFNCVTHFMDL